MRVLYQALALTLAVLAHVHVLIAQSTSCPLPSRIPTTAMFPGTFSPIGEPLLIQKNVGAMIVSRAREDFARVHVLLNRKLAPFAMADYAECQFNVRFHSCVHAFFCSYMFCPRRYSPHVGTGFARSHRQPMERQLAVLVASLGPTCAAWTLLYVLVRVRPI